MRHAQTVEHRALLLLKVWSRLKEDVESSHVSSNDGSGEDEILLLNAIVAGLRSSFKTKEASAVESCDDIPLLTQLRIEMKIRVADWKEGTVGVSFTRTRLQNLASRLHDALGNGNDKLEHHPPLIPEEVAKDEVKDFNVEANQRGGSAKISEDTSGTQISECAELREEGGEQRVPNSTATKEKLLEEKLDTVKTEDASDGYNPLTPIRI